MLLPRNIIHMNVRILSLLLLGALLCNQAFAQKPALDHSVYDDWKNIFQPNISRSGQYIYYAVNPQEGDALVELKKSNNELLLQVPRGYNVQLAHDESFLVSSIKPFFAETREARIKKKKGDELPKDSLMVYHIGSGQEIKYANVKSYKVARQGGEYVAFMSELIEEVAKDTTGNVDGEERKTTSAKKPKTTSVLHLLHVETGDTTNFLKIDTYDWSDNEQYLVLTKKGEDKDSVANDAGVYLYDLSSRALKKISNGKGAYKQFTFDDNQVQLSFLADKSDEKALLKDFQLYYYTPQLDTAIVLADQQTSGVPQNWYISGDGQINFSANGGKLYFGIAPIPLVKDTTLVEFEHAKLDIWHWQDDYLQTQQLSNLRRDQSRSFTAVIYPKEERKVVPLSDETFSRVVMTDQADEEWVLVTSDHGNRIQSQWDLAVRSNIYLVSTRTGENKLILKDLNGQALLSPNAEHVVYFDRDDASWNSYTVETGTTYKLNDGVEVSFVDEENDVPALPGPYGIAGWSEDGDIVYINDRYDIWSFNLQTKQKQMETNGYGRANRVRFRAARIIPQSDLRSRTFYIKSGKELFLNAFDEKTKYGGFYSATFGGRRAGDPKSVIMEPKTFRNVSSDENFKQLIYTKEDYIYSPDLYVNTTRMNKEVRLTDINPQQANYNWGTAEIVQWTTPKGYEAEGILYKPEDFDPNKTYPIIAYFYEKLSDGLYGYQAPAPTPSRLNIPFFVSNGYLVFAPDIQYEIGYPGRSAEEFVNSGMQYLARNHSWVDSTKMGIQGQSWGGYQVAHLITRTDMYAAAWSGAPVVNMTSAYGGIRWGTGMSRQFQYENTQSRIGKNLWEAHDLYIENSPLFFMDRVNTPVAIMHNDKDGAVPWYQGIEMFTALRRLQKPVWMLNYNDDEHNLIQRQNRKDIQIRELQFFDHFLKGKPAARWISTGVPAIHKGIDWGLEVD